MCARSAAVLNNPHKLHSSILHQHKSFAARFKPPLWRENCTKIVTRRVSARWNISSREWNKVCNAVNSFWYCDIQQSQNNIYFSCLHFNVNRIKLLTQYHIIHCFICRYVYWRTPRLLAAWYMECVWGLLPAGIAGSNYVGAWMSVSFCHVLSSSSGWSFVQRSPAECGISECDREASAKRRPWPIRRYCAIKSLAILINVDELKDGLRRTAHICNKTLLSVESYNL